MADSDKTKSGQKAPLRGAEAAPARPGDLVTIRDKKGRETTTTRQSFHDVWEAKGFKIVEPS